MLASGSPAVYEGACVAPSHKRMKAVASAIGARIATLRRAAGLRQAELAERVNPTPAVVSRVETGRELASVQRIAEDAPRAGDVVRALLKRT